MRETDRQTDRQTKRHRQTDTDRDHPPQSHPRDLTEKTVRSERIHFKKRHNSQDPAQSEIACPMSFTRSDLLLLFLLQLLLLLLLLMLLLVMMMLLMMMMMKVRSESTKKTKLIRETDRQTRDLRETDRHKESDMMFSTPNRQ